MPVTNVAEEDRLRAGWYSLIGRLLGAPPDEGFLQNIRRLEGDDSELGQAVAALAAAARGVDAVSVEQEYFDLFIGVGESEITPYASYYITGFLHDRPLARLREDMGSLGIARAEGVSEPEDHIASLFEMMAGLIEGQFGQPADLETQRKFFDTHVGCWAPRFFNDLQAAPSARLYMPVGSIGSTFMAIESQAFEMAA